MKDIINSGIPIARGYFREKKESDGYISKYYKKNVGFMLCVAATAMAVGTLACGIKDLIKGFK